MAASSPWKHAIVVGASSGMGAEVARLLAAQGCKVALVARREAELNALAEELNRVRGGAAHAYVHDVTSYDEVPALFQQVCRDLGGLDLIVYASGVMPHVAEDEFDFEKDWSVVEVNLLGAIAWLNPAAQRFAAAGAGTIVGVSSVAGDRGRRGNTVYGATKAALNAYLESLRNRLGTRGVTVVTVKPGPVETPMTRGLGRMPFMISAPEAARQIVSAARRRANTAYVPGIWRVIMAVVRAIPSAIFRHMKF
jgi:short-subunit dehydrogenase